MEGCFGEGGEFAGGEGGGAGDVDVGGGARGGDWGEVVFGEGFEDCGEGCLEGGDGGGGGGVDWGDEFDAVLVWWVGG